MLRSRVGRVELSARETQSWLDDGEAGRVFRLETEQTALLMLSAKPLLSEVRVVCGRAPMRVLLASYQRPYGRQVRV